MNQAILKELQRLSQLNSGVLQPRAVVEAAREPSSPLHSQFEWDDSKAAEDHRIQQARQLIRVSVKLLDSGDSKSTTQVFVSLSSDRQHGGGYRVLSDVLANEGQREQLLADAHREMRAFTRKYSTLVELAGVFQAMQEAVDAKKAA